MAKLKALVTDKRPFGGQDVVPRKQPDWTWVEPELVCESIQYAGWSGGGMVGRPRSRLA